MKMSSFNSETVAILIVDNVIFRLSKQKSETPTRKSKQIAEHNAKNKQEKDKIDRKSVV